MKSNIKNLIKRLIGFVFLYGGGFHFLRFLNNLIGRRLTIITYHRITENDIECIKWSLPFLFITKKNFEEQLKFIKKWYKIIDFEELDKYIKRGIIPWNLMIITFDDGYEDNFLIAYKILKKNNLKATFFIPSNKIRQTETEPFWWDKAYYIFRFLSTKSNENILNKLNKKYLPLIESFKKNPSKLFNQLNKFNTEEVKQKINKIEKIYQIEEETIIKENKLLKWGQLLEMSQEMEIGSHSCNHRNLCYLEDADKIYEIFESKRELESKLNKTILAFSFPGGNKEDCLEEILKKAGYKFAVTTNQGVNKLKNPYSLKRINIWEDTSLSLSKKFSKGFFAYKLLGF